MGAQAAPSVDGVHSCIIAKWGRGEKSFRAVYLRRPYFLVCLFCLIIYLVAWQIMSVSLTILLCLAPDDDDLAAIYLLFYLLHLHASFYAATFACISLFAVSRHL